MISDQCFIINRNKGIQRIRFFDHLAGDALPNCPSYTLATGLAEFGLEGVPVIPQVGGHRMPGIAYRIDAFEILHIIDDRMKADEFAHYMVLLAVIGESLLESLDQRLLVPCTGNDQRPAIPVRRDKVVICLPVHLEINLAPNELMGNTTMNGFEFERLRLAALYALAGFSVPWIKIDIRRNLLFHIRYYPSCSVSFRISYKSPSSISSVLGATSVPLITCLIVCITMRISPIRVIRFTYSTSNANLASQGR